MKIILSQGTLAGGIIAIIINMWIALGSFMYGNKASLSEPVTTSGCFQGNSVGSELKLSSTTYPYNLNTSYILDNHNDSYTNQDTVR